jgi:hypothetical protein
MATKFSSTLQCSNSTTTLLRAWIQFFHDLLITTGGWVDPGDTGQLTIASAAVPGGANTKIGFRIYRMADTLQATAPCFIRIDYGSGAAANTPGMWITIGTGTNGAGTITGVLFNGGGAASPQASPGLNDTTACNSYGSSDTNRFQFLGFVRASGNNTFILTLERTKDASTGADTALGFLLAYGDTTTGLGVTGYFNATPGAQPSIERPSYMLSNSSAFGSNVGVALIGYFNGTLAPFGLGLIVVNSTDFSAEASLTMSVYGTVHTYQLSNTGTQQVFLATGASNGTSRIGARVGIRYE